MGADFLEKIEKLSYDKKKEVEDFVDFLLSKTTESQQNLNVVNIKRGFGGGKGIFGKMADDFDEPLDDMKDYM